MGDELGFFLSSCFSFGTRSRVDTGWWCTYEGTPTLKSVKRVVSSQVGEQ